MHGRRRACSRRAHPPRRRNPGRDDGPEYLKCVAIFQIRLPHFRSLFSHVFSAKPLHTFVRHALATLGWGAACPINNPRRNHGRPACLHGQAARTLPAKGKDSQPRPACRPYA
ncbi:hypothetical protein EFD55_25295 [Rhizobium pisi]|uniref:Uncharacterized protein n=1 Tax=Rhizobium pisi TaxID=574561 RepID=A0A427MDW1_9HYPH|nr:hypothetical protein EFD55_25295 [Rhizobium pisi]TCA48105.1 hypothetical protein E0J16_26845 [Rhizobium pisi]